MSESDDIKDPLAEDRARLLDHILSIADYDGWSVETLREAANAAGLDRNQQILIFPRGVIDALFAYSAACDERMVEILAEHDLHVLKIREQITLAVKTRLNTMAEHRPAAAAAMRFLALPMHGASGTQLLYQTVDAIWRACGDESTDFNFYTKRATLAGVYASTFMIWQNDESPEQEETSAFLDRRIANVMQFEKVKGRVLSKLQSVPSPLATLSRLRYGGRTR